MITIKPPKRILTTSEVMSIIHATPNIRERAMISISYFTGIRPIELSNITQQSIDNRTRSILVHSTKTNSYRIIPIHPIAYKDLQIYLQTNPENERIFVTSKMHLNKMSEYLSMTLRFYAKSAKVYMPETITAYSLRHSFATHLLEQNIPITTIATILGHRDPEVTLMYYTNLSTNTKRKAILEAFQEIKPK